MVLLPERLTERCCSFGACGLDRPAGLSHAVLRRVTILTQFSRTPVRRLRGQPVEHHIHGAIESAEVGEFRC